MHTQCCTLSVCMYYTAVWAIVMNIDKPQLSEESQLSSHL